MSKNVGSMSVAKTKYQNNVESMFGKCQKFLKHVAAKAKYKKMWKNMCETCQTMSETCPWSKQNLKKHVFFSMDVLGLGLWVEIVSILK